MSMTPKEKATELIQKYLPIANGGEAFHIIVSKSKQCALIAVDELINESSHSDYTIGRNQLDNKEYWQQVHTEIEQI